MTTKILTKSRNKIWLAFIASVITVLALFGLTGCGNESLTEDDIIAMGYKIAVVFDYNGGTVKDMRQTKIRIKEGSKVPNPNTSQSTVGIPVRDAYSFKNFCVAQTDENGELLRDAEGNLIPGKVWDFEKDIPDGNMTLVAQWWDNYSMVLHYGDNYVYSKQRSVSRMQNGDPTFLLESDFTAANFTFLDYYYDREQTQKIDKVPMTLLTKEMFENSDDGLTLHVWGETLNGIYTVVRKAEDFSSLVIDSNTNIYLDTDVVLPDNAKVMFPDTYNGEFLGRGHTISNLKREVASMNNSDYYYGIFKNIGASAKISDITFKNVALKVDITNPSLSEANIGLLAGRVAKDAHISEVNISGSVEYELTAGFTDLDKIRFNGKIGVDQGAFISGGSYTCTSFIGSEIIYTADKQYAVYAKYIEQNGVKVLGDVYDLAELFDGSYSGIRIRTIEKISDGHYRINGRTVVYNVTIADNGDDKYSATVSIQ